MIVRDENQVACLKLPLVEWIRLLLFIYPKAGVPLEPSGMEFSYTVGTRLVVCDVPPSTAVWLECVNEAQRQDSEYFPIRLDPPDYSFLLEALEEGAFSSLIDKKCSEGGDQYVDLLQTHTLHKMLRITVHPRYKRMTMRKVQPMAEVAPVARTVPELRAIFESEYRARGYDLKMSTSSLDGGGTYAAHHQQWAWEAFLLANELQGLVLKDHDITAESTGAFLEGLKRDIEFADRLYTLPGEAQSFMDIQVRTEELMSLATSFTEAIRRLRHHVKDSKFFEAFHK